jgi:threonine synthase
MIPSLSEKKVTHRCVRCNKIYPHAFRAFCSCDGMIDTEYDLQRVQYYDSEYPLLRYFDLVPLEEPDNLVRALLPQTPCVHAVRLGRLLGIPRLYLKDETKNPTRTTKDRMAAIALSYMKECGVRAFCTSSTGNSSSAFVHMAEYVPECQIYIFTAEDFADRVEQRNETQVVHFVIRDESFVGAFNCAGRFAEANNVTSERGFFNPGRREGLKLAYLEAAEQIPGPIDWYVQAISSAMGVYGEYKGARELRAIGKATSVPRLLCVQQESCAPVCRAFLEGAASVRSEHIVRRPNGIAKAILRGDPMRSYPYIRSMLLESGGTCAIASEAEIREARTMVLEYEGIDICYSAATAVAGLVNLVRRGGFPQSDTVLVNLTGADREPARQGLRVYLRRVADGWEPEDPATYPYAPLRMAAA